jgi:hypothetical protein
MTPTKDEPRESIHAYIEAVEKRVSEATPKEGTRNDFI